MLTSLGVFVGINKVQMNSFDFMDDYVRIFYVLFKNFDPAIPQVNFYFNFFNFFKPDA